jgi:hypothetical protein
MTSVGFLAGSGLDFIVGNLVGEAPPLGTGVAIDHYRAALIPMLAMLAIGAVCAIALRDNKESSATAPLESLSGQQ